MKAHLLLAFALALSGCHAKFKKHAAEVGQARVQVVVSGGPEVMLGRADVGSTGIVGAVVNVAQAVNEVELSRRIGGAVDVPAVAVSLESGIGEVLGGGPPFAYTNDPAAPGLLELELLSYGLYAPYLGAPGSFTFEARARVYLPDGDRIYSKRLTCTAGVGDPELAAVALGFVNNTRQVQEMTDAEINDVFQAVAQGCGNQFVVKMRKHAG
jgi:hypothetical protein